MTLRIRPLKTRGVFRVDQESRFVALLVENDGWYAVPIGGSEAGPFETQAEALAVIEKGD